MQKAIFINYNNTFIILLHFIYLWKTTSVQTVKNARLQISFAIKNTNKCLGIINSIKLSMV